MGVLDANVLSNRANSQHARFLTVPSVTPLIAPTYVSFSSQCHFPPFSLRLFLLMHNCFHHSIPDTHIRPDIRAITADGSRCEMTPHCRGTRLFLPILRVRHSVSGGGKLIGFHVSHPPSPWLGSVTSRTPSRQADSQWHLLKSKWRKWEMLVTSNSPPASLSSFSVSQSPLDSTQRLTEVSLLHSYYFTIRHLRGTNQRIRRKKKKEKKTS